MDKAVKDTIEDCTAGSDAARYTFPQVVMKLMAAGVERYHADLVRAEKVYYLPDGSSHGMAAAPVAGGFATAFSAAGVDAAVRAVQAGKVNYQQFCELVAAAGCVGYFVSLSGRRAVYYGRGGETHVEPFPAAR